MISSLLQPQSDFDLSTFLQITQARVDQTIATALTDQNSPFAATPTKTLSARLLGSMRYSTANGGKRLRPALLFATAQALLSESAKTFEQEQFTQLEQDLDLLAAAVVCIHAYSLIHDDLPAMDDDNLRRGKPTCHIQYDEATAILAGDGLQSLAFQLVTETKALSPQQQIELVRVLSLAAGPFGMVGGQAIDLAAVNQNIDLEHLKAMHALKTGALIRVSVEMGAIACQANDNQRQKLDQYADALGLAFQVQDDILDVESDTETLGKTQGADIALNKPTYPALLGLQGAKEKAKTLHHHALNAIECLGNNNQALKQIANFVIQRTH